jgi:hypothetical protein
MIYSPVLPLSHIKTQLSKLKKLSYNKFKWWRMYGSYTNPLPNKSPLIDKILNGDFEYPHYKLQAELVEHELNSLALKFGGNNEMFVEKSSLLRSKRKRLLDDFEKEENEKLKYMIKEFTKNFPIPSEEIEEEMLRFGGNLEEFYHYMSARYGKISNPNKRNKRNKI